jgi:phage terminase small subunit
LNYRQAVFVASYLGECRFNATRAALKAGYSPRHPRQSGSQAKGSMKVQNAISTLLNYYVANSQ